MRERRFITVIAEFKLRTEKEGAPIQPVRKWDLALEREDGTKL
jgi:hypothetical protein